MKQFIEMEGDIANFKTRKYLGDFDYIPNAEDFEEGDYLSFTDIVCGDETLRSNYFICIDLPSIESIPKAQKIYEESVHGIINNWTDREWELFKTIKPFDLEENMIVYFDKWLHDNIDDKDRSHMDLRNQQ